MKQLTNSRTHNELFLTDEMTSFAPKLNGVRKYGRAPLFLRKWHGQDNRHYWLTPPELYEQLNLEFNFDFDPCPFPLPDGFDGLTCEWGKSNFVNPPFGAIMHDGKKKGPTAWARKAIEEHRKGKKVVLLFPLDKWVHLLLEEGAKVRNLGDIKWCATEDGEPGKGTGWHIAAFILE